MEREEIIKHARRMLAKVTDGDSIVGTYSEACDLIRTTLGQNSSFLKSLESAEPIAVYNARVSYAVAARQIQSVLEAFIENVETGLYQEVSPERRAQLDVVSDFLEMANLLLESNGVRPAAPAVIIGATLEEFLRTWIETEGLSLGGRKQGLEAYSQVLRDANLITKQDGKDITSWAGIRNHAAHGEWDEVSDKNKISLMLQGINLFMRKYSP